VSAAAFGPRSGLTLIEIVVVLIIFSLGWFSLLPAMSPDEDKGAPGLEPVNEMLQQARSRAMAEAQIQKLRVRLGEDVIVWGERSEELPSIVGDCQINGRTSLGGWAVFRIYPAGSMDELRLSLKNGEVIQAAPLTAALGGVR
jgi:prepilin-type N-terminal cleavage/methylation domain-containing protein